MSTQLVAELMLVRHGQSAANVAFAAAEAGGAVDVEISGSDADVELSPLGWQQAATLGQRLAVLPLDRRPEVAVCSPYLRARQTWQAAVEVTAEHGRQLPVAELDERLCDRLMGDLELLTTATIGERFPAEAARRRAVGEYLYRPPGGESFGDIAVRLASFLADLHQRHAGRRVVVVAHDAVVLMMRYVLEHLTFEDVAAIVQAGPVANASITRFTAVSGQLELAEYNAVDHLVHVPTALATAGAVEL